MIVIFINRDSTILNKLSSESPRREKTPDLLIIDFRLLLPIENVSLPVNMLPGPGYFVKN